MNSRQSDRERAFAGTAVFLLIAAVLLESLYLFYALNDSSTLLKRNNFYYIIINGIAFVIFAAAAIRIRAVSFERAETKKILWIIIGSAMIFRATLLFTHTATSDDWYRYGYEGTVLRNGYNPYEVTPADSTTMRLFSEEFYSRVILKSMTTMYPPAAHLFFVSGTWLTGESMTGLKAIFLLFDLLTMLLILRLLKQKGVAPQNVLLYAWMPLIVMEFFINVHIDTAALPFFLLFLIYGEDERPYASMLSFTAMFLIKTYAIFALPLLFRKISPRRLVMPSLLAAAIIAGAYLPFANGSHPLHESLFKYLRHWEFNGSVYNILKLFFSDHVYARSICGGLFIIAAGIVFFRFRDFTKGVFAVYLLFMIFSATVFPWYLSWIAALTPVAGMLSPIVLSGVVNLSNLTPLAPVWKESAWIWITEYSVFFIFLAYDFRQNIFSFFKRKRPSP